jgi:hypothetical protein
MDIWIDLRLFICYLEYVISNPVRIVGDTVALANHSTMLMPLRLRGRARTANASDAQRAVAARSGGSCQQPHTRPGARTLLPSLSRCCIAPRASLTHAAPKGVAPSPEESALAPAREGMSDR